MRFAGEELHYNKRLGARKAERMRAGKPG